MSAKTRDDHLFGAGPKRILALDGGGIRGALTLGYLGRMEDILRDRHGGDPEFRLCDYFDLIGGTSTGSIIATGLALGFAVDELVDLYRSLGEKVFDKSRLRLGLFGAKFPKEPLLRALDTHFGDMTLGGDELRTGLMIMTKRLDTGSPWLLHNNPRGKYFDGDGGSYPNRDLLLRNIVRASTAAPHYFEPETLRIAPGVTGAFVDGGVSPYNNPALQMLMLATCSGYGLNWRFGAENLMLVSAGTGHRPLRMTAAQVTDMPAVVLAAQSMLSIMADANWLGQAVLQWLASSPTSWQIDSEIGDLRDDRLGPGPDLITYQRYEVSLEPNWLRDTLDVHIDDEQCDALYAMDNPKNLTRLASLGVTAGAVQVQPDHFPPGFDLL
ncbi:MULTISPECIES: patatin-like phospholipase family protein [Mycolicibacterium]|uniref:Patatin n=1 Tax=Mycolicibacterium gilvum (strain DSM 45189 / LMG 24558 / Spyr1) TaxID=278137 RepID=E6TJA0_MYCSR|nr:MULTISPECIES: patatin-like phospholipase family protein [Mycolicibacterium]ADU00246.1 patatin [Mycolicibacterium gilvum Spyr1]MBV5242887.1 patatin-like phospholipase family protein [Mycolicibacterium sp. PAM1]